MLGLALGGGAYRGVAHLGVLKAFEEEGLNPGFLSGTSSGGLAAAFYAFGMPLSGLVYPSVPNPTENRKT